MRRSRNTNHGVFPPAGTRYNLATQEMTCGLQRDWLHRTLYVHKVPLILSERYLVVCGINSLLWLCSRSTSWYERCQNREYDAVLSPSTRSENSTECFHLFPPSCRSVKNHVSFRWPSARDREIHTERCPPITSWPPSGLLLEISAAYESGAWVSLIEVTCLTLFINFTNRPYIEFPCGAKELFINSFWGHQKTNIQYK